MFRRGKKVRFYFEGQEVEAYEGESIAAALYAIGIDVFSYSTKLSRPRGPFCMIGKCYSCLVVVDGVPYVRACTEYVRDGIRVERQRGLPSIPQKAVEEYVESEEVVDTDVVVVGGGPAGLAAAIEVAKYGLNVVLVNERPKLGGQLVKHTHKLASSEELFGGLRGFQLAELLSNEVRKYSNVKILLQSTVYGVFRDGWIGVASRDRLYRVRPRAVIVATGAIEQHLTFPGNDMPGVMSAGGVQTLMNEFGIKPCDRALIVGAGNVGLMTAYQLLQVGVEVVAVLEIGSEIGGWFIHAAKIRRYGVPILTRHTIKAAWGFERIEGATIVRVDENLQPIPGSERDVECDLILIAIGLTPDTRLFAQAQTVMKWIPELGGAVPIRTIDMETSVPNMYVAGDASGIEEAITAVIEGRIAAYSVITKLSDSEEKRREAEHSMRKLIDFLWNEYRASPLLTRAREGKRKATVSYEEMEELRKRYPPLIAFR